MTANPIPTSRDGGFLNLTGSAPTDARGPAEAFPTASAGSSLAAQPRREAQPVRLVYRQGFPRVAWEDLSDPTLRQVAQAICRGLGMGPGDLAVEAAGTGAWAISKGLFDDQPPKGTRLVRVEGVGARWLKPAFDQLLNSGWEPPPPHLLAATAAPPTPPAALPPAT